MNRQIFAWDCSRDKRQGCSLWLEWMWGGGLLLAAVALFGTNLGSLPLSDREIEMVAQGAKEIFLAAEGRFDLWLAALTNETTASGSLPFSGLVAWFYAIGGANEWTTRLPGALLAALSVPLLYGIGREIFPSRAPALFSALIYLLFVPIWRFGRLALLGGPILCFSLCAMLCILRSRRDLRWSLGVGMSLGGLGLIDGKIALLASAIALLFLALDTPRLLSSPFFWLGAALGSGSATLWYVAQWLSVSQKPISSEFVSRILTQNASALDLPSLPVWFYCQNILTEAWPWLLFSVGGLSLAQKYWNWSWAKLVLLWSGVYLPVISLSGASLAGAVLPIYPVLALAGGAALSEAQNLPSRRSYPTAWAGMFAILSLGATVACLAVAIAPDFNFSFVLTLASVALTLAVVAVSIERKDRQFTTVLFWGMYVSLLLLASSPYWMWGMEMDRSVKSVADLIARNTPAEQIVYTELESRSKALSFYSDRLIVAQPLDRLQQIWETVEQPYLLLRSSAWEQLDLESSRELGATSPDWRLIARENS